MEKQTKNYNNIIVGENSIAWKYPAITVTATAHYLKNIQISISEMYNYSKGVYKDICFMTYFTHNTAQTIVDAGVHYCFLAQ